MADPIALLDSPPDDESEAETNQIQRAAGNLMRHKELQEAAKRFLGIVKVKTPKDHHRRVLKLASLLLVDLAFFDLTKGSS